MITCLNCGYPRNAATTDKCVACGASIPAIVQNSQPKVSEGSTTATPISRVTVVQRQVGTSSEIPRETDSDQKLDAKASASNSKAEEKQDTDGLHDTQDLKEDTQYIFPSGRARDIEEEKVKEHKQAKDQPLRGTISLNEFKSRTEKPVLARLTPVNHNGQEIRIQSSEVTLSRAVLDQEDLSISKERHLQVEKKEGSWTLENLSSNGAVFIQVTDQTLLKDGDIILVGASKMYQFKTQK